MKKTIIIAYMLLFGTMAVAQPLPPSTPSGSPIPVSNIGGLIALVLGITIFLYRKNYLKNRRIQ